VQRFKICRDWAFPLNSQGALEAASIPDIDETTSMTAPTPTTFGKDQDTNYVQIFQRSVNISYAAQSATSKLSGLAIYGEEFTPNDLDYQKMMTLKQIALDLELALVTGTAQAPANDDTASKTQGIIGAISTNSVNAGGDALTTADVETAMIALAETNEAPMEDLYIMGNAAAIKKLADLYGFAPFAGPENTTGGNRINEIITQFGRLKVMWDPYVTALNLVIVDMAQCDLVGLPVPGKGVLFYEELPKTGANEKGQFYGQLGLNYTAEEWHAKVHSFT